MNKIAITNHSGLCWKCLKNLSSDRIICIDIPSLGYGSSFDMAGTQVQLCKSCFGKTNAKWWALNVIEDRYLERYEFEDEIIAYFDSFDICAQELIWNSYNKDHHILEPQDWIDYSVGSFTEEQAKKYGLDYDKYLESLKEGD